MIRDCKKCGQANRIPPKHLAHTGRCGKCGVALSPLATPLSVSPDEFSTITDSATEPILVDFWADWCGPCRMAAPEVARVAQDLAGKAIVLKVDTQRHPDLAARFRVSGIPHFVVLKNGKIVHEQAGLVGHRQMEGWLTPHLGQ